jgi:hypothetical protein
MCPDEVGVLDSNEPGVGGWRYVDGVCLWKVELEGLIGDVEEEQTILTNDFWTQLCQPSSSVLIWKRVE